MNRQPRIIVIGSCNVDLTTFTDQFPRPGETIFGERFDLGFGGKGANQAVASRLCGAEVAMVAKVGNDLFGPATIENFKRCGIDTTCVEIVNGHSSGVAPIFVDGGGQNRIIVVKGANDLLHPEDIDRARETIRTADCMVLQFEIPLKTVYYAIRFARENGIRCIVNPAPGQPVDLQAVRDADYLVPNETEAETITGRPVRNLEDARSCAEYFLGQGLRRVIITLGANGSLFAGPHGIQHVPSFPVQSVDTTGAGDAFIGSFAVFLGQGMSEAEALPRANLYAALSTMQVGTQKSFPSRDAFELEWTRRSEIRKREVDVHLE